MSAARKLVIVRKLSRDWCAGYASADFSRESTELELLDASGRLLKIQWTEVKWVCYIRELAAGEGSAAIAADATGPERLLRRKFSGRPRIAGVWLRITLADGDELEGVAANDRSFIDGSGLLLTPPDTRSNTQRIFVPRGTVRDFEILGVIAPAKASRQRRGLQPELFSSESAEGSEP